MNTKTLKNGETIHDFRPHKLCWGWNGSYWKVADDKKSATMMGNGSGLKEGDYIALNHGKKDMGYLIIEVNYDTNPKDLFTVKLKGACTFDEGELD
jgi:hypothetical protein